MGYQEDFSKPGHQVNTGLPVDKAIDYNSPEYNKINDRLSFNGIVLSSTAHFGLMTYALSQMSFHLLTASSIALISAITIANYDTAFVSFARIDKGRRKLEREEATDEVPTDTKFANALKIFTRLGFSFAVASTLALFVIFGFFAKDIVSYTVREQLQSDQPLIFAANNKFEASLTNRKDVVAQKRSKFEALQSATDEQNKNRFIVVNTIQDRIDEVKKEVQENQDTNAKLIDDIKYFAMNARCESSGIRHQGCEPVEAAGEGDKYLEWATRGELANKQRAELSATIADLEDLQDRLTVDLAKERASISVVVPEALNIALDDLEAANQELHAFKSGRAAWVTERVTSDPDRVVFDPDSVLQRIRALIALSTENAEFAALLLTTKAILILIECLGLLIGMTAPVGPHEMRLAARQRKEIKQLHDEFKHDLRESLQHRDAHQPTGATNANPQVPA
ncbi:DUF4407 domain-containing protein [uncultured Roseobacter sp.]|uniref:DUF4407 domain-containing protein n=1 Tax=uncultured Roseobacter sp. TaxID=114847 RepID=UPI002607247A|nr:DUF4407 domain-containing protein [uncultured Roseobacter sp.]